MTMREIQTLFHAFHKIKNVSEKSMQNVSRLLKSMKIMSEQIRIMKSYINS